MKLGLFTNCFSDKSWEYVCALVSKSGITGIEPGAGGFPSTSHCKPDILLKDPDELEKFKMLAKKSGLNIYGFDVQGNPLHPDKKYAEKHKADLVNAIELAAKVGAKVVNCFAGCPGVAEDDPYPNWVCCYYPDYFSKASKWQWEEKIIPFWKEMVKLARKYKVKFGFEMHVGDSVYNVSTLLKLREAVDAEEIGACLDLGQLFVFGLDPIACIKELGKNNAIHNVHAQDTKINKSAIALKGVNDYENYSKLDKRSWVFKLVGYGHGQDTWTDIIDTLRMVGYDDYITIENLDALISAEEGLNKAVEFLNKIIFHKEVGERRLE
ncbi:MAG: sugar phosphate isomerase/epimerase [Actinobacteria bacterium]|nr:sugar phosphate isomerase/epimerase [Actinomycetota bacterium]